MTGAQWPMKVEFLAPAHAELPDVIEYYEVRLRGLQSVCGKKRPGSLQGNRGRFVCT